MPLVYLRGTCWGFRKLSACRHKAYRDKTVASVVREIAKLGDLEVEQSGVDETEGKMTFYQCGMSDWRFLSYLKFYASCRIEGVPRSDFFTYVDSGRSLVFRTPRFRDSLAAKFAFGATKKGVYPIAYARVDYREPQVVGAGSFFVRGLGYDPVKKEEIDAEAADWRDPFPHPFDAPSMPYPPDDPQKIVSLTYPDSEDFAKSQVKDGVLSIWQEGGQSLFRVVVHTIPVVDIPLLSMVNLSILDGSGKDHFMSGTYMVHKIMHHLTSANWITSFGLERRSQAYRG